ncbi:hypothetical protein JKP88DRAFT_272010 [Tribonema minus]|uniref:Pathogen-related protein n=1 Tax=Tribonema minus TaxID=303371 RepID=A0A835Z3T6_9STRA|nr:hypothetical protein JKP88DRAFT_272010 [Tribonema minus]
MAVNNFLEPNRGDLSKYESHVWRSGMPDYTIANMAYCKGKTKNHMAGSLELLVENLVKTWEMEASHVKDTSAWTTIDHANYTASANGGKKFDLAEAAHVGNYNVLMDNTNKELYNAQEETFESSHHAFRNAFPEGFPWELLEVMSGPPKVAFTWRHWASFAGEYRGHKGEGQLVEMYGFCVATVNESLKVQELEIYYKPEDFLRVLEGKAHASTLSHGKSLVGSGCPVMRHAAAANANGSGAAAHAIGVANGSGVCPHSHGA